MPSERPAGTDAVFEGAKTDGADAADGTDERGTHDARWDSDSQADYDVPDVHEPHDAQGDSDDEDDDGVGGLGGDSDGDPDGEGDHAAAPDGPGAADFRLGEELTDDATRTGAPALTLGVIGCSETAQLLHVPHLSSLSGTAITAVADRSRERVEHVGDQYDIAHRYQQGAALIAEHSADLDGVVICSPPHTHVALVAAALDAGLATFVEPPLAVTPDDAWALQDRASQADAPVMVGYTKRYDPATHRLGTVLRRSGPVRHVAAYGVTPVGPRIHRTASDPIPGPLPPELAAEADRTLIGQAKDALETDTDWIAEAYLSHLGQCCHDLNLLRAVFEDVVEIHHAALDGPGQFLTAELGYEAGPSCHLTAGRTNGTWCDEYVRVDAADRTIRLDCPAPSRRHPSSAVTITEGTDDVVTRRHVPPADAAVSGEFGSFLAAIREGTRTQTPVVDAAMDVELVAELIHRATADAGGSGE